MGQLGAKRGREAVCDFAEKFDGQALEGESGAGRMLVFIRGLGMSAGFIYPSSGHVAFAAEACSASAA